MKKKLIGIFATALIAFSACKGKKAESNSAADSAQVHTGNEGVTDSANIKTSPVENGGKDTSGNGVGGASTPKDTTNRNP